MPQGRPPPPNRQATQPQARKKKQATTTQPRRIHHPKATQQELAQYREAERRTQVLRRVPPLATAATIIRDLAAQWSQEDDQPPINDIIDSVLRDSLDRRRFYVTYATMDLRREYARRGFRIRDHKTPTSFITIPPEVADVSAFIPDVPHFITSDDVVRILSHFGNVTTAEFVTFQNTGVRCGPLHFTMDLHDNSKLPSHISLLDHIMTIVDKNGHKLCTFCDNFGHLRNHCRKRLSQLHDQALREADDELAAELDVSITMSIDGEADENREGDNDDNEQGRNNEGGGDNGDDGNDGTGGTGGDPIEVPKNDTTPNTSQQQHQQQQKQQQQQHSPKHQPLPKRPKKTNEPLVPKDTNFIIQADPPITINSLDLYDICVEHTKQEFNQRINTIIENHPRTDDGSFQSPEDQTLNNILSNFLETMQHTKQNMESIYPGVKEAIRKQDPDFWNTFTKQWHRYIDNKNFVHVIEATCVFSY